MTPANSVAYCALRDPVTKIYALFPDASSYKSIVHKIDLATKEQVSAKASFSLHQDELGQHTLYIAMKDELPLGIIHSRSEVGLWGLIEIVWAFDFDLNVVDFTFQRCRESACKQIAALPFRHLLKGKSSSELTAMLKSSSTVYQQISGLKTLGCKIAFDDFGCEKSNFSRLLELNIDIVKIDGMFIKNIHKDPKSYKLAKAITNLAKDFDCEVVAEGVECFEAQQIVEELCIDYTQGYYFSKPEEKI